MATFKRGASTLSSRAACANEYIDEAVRNDCELITGAKVQEVIVENGSAAGVVATLSGGNEVMRIEAKTVILSAGGIGTPIILQHSGLPEAGRGMTMDTTAIVYGESREEGMSMDPPMAVSWCDDDNGYMLSTLMEPWMLYSMNLALKGSLHPFRYLRFGKAMGIMIKVKDEISGGINMEGKISKPLTDQDRWRLNHASNLCRKILIQAGCRPDSIFLSPYVGTHPSGTVRIGDLLTTQLETPIKNLYVSDASCFPEALDRPTVLTIIALSKRLARHILEADMPKPRAQAKKTTKAAVKKKKAKPKPKPKAKTKPIKKPTPEVKAETEGKPETEPKPTPEPEPSPTPEPVPPSRPEPEPEPSE